MADHTNDVEKRVMAIPISPYDTCVFYTQKDGSLVDLPQCVYCAYSSFANIFDISAMGFCKFKR